MKIIKIMNEFLHAPIWYCDENGIEWDNEEEFKIFKQDEQLQLISKKIEEMFNQYYEFDTHNVACWFNKEQEKQDKEKMLKLLDELNKRLAEINDGSFEIEDLETERVKNL